jgi:hypothetical protein
MADITLGPVPLPRLRSLSVTVFGFQKPPFIDSIYHVYETLATSSSSLENLKIKIWYSQQFHQYEGGRLAKLVVRNHGLTIRSIIIDEMILSSESLIHLCSNCPNLETLGFSPTKRSGVVSKIPREIISER